MKLRGLQDAVKKNPPRPSLCFRECAINNCFKSCAAESRWHDGDHKCLAHRKILCSFDCTRLNCQHLCSGEKYHAGPCYCPPHQVEFDLQLAREKERP